MSKTEIISNDLDSLEEAILRLSEEELNLLFEKLGWNKDFDSVVKRNKEAKSKGLPATSSVLDNTGTDALYDVGIFKGKDLAELISRLKY